MRSPTVLEKPSAASVKAEAHWAIASSEAPAQTISRIASQKTGSRNSSRIFIPLPSSVSRSMGQVAKLYMLYSGTRAQTQASHFQCSIPNTAKNSVERRITPTEPQQ